MSTQPIYIHLAERLRKELLTGPEATPGAKLPTERQLQERYGVSRTTVARALALLVSQGLIRSRQGSGAYIAENAAFNEAVRLIAYVAPHIPKPDAAQNAIPVQVYYGLEQRAHELGYQLLTASANFSVAHEEKLIEQFLRIGVEGILLQPVNYPEPRLRQDAARDYLARRWQKTPIIVMDIGFEDWGRPLILFDNYRLGYEMTRALLAHGHRHILFMHTGPERLHTSIHDRQRGWQAALERTGVEIPGSYRDWPMPRFDFMHELTEAHMEALAQDILRLSPRPDAVIAWEDGIAMQLMQALQQQGVRIPADLRVTGFDNHDIGRYFQPPFPTSAPDFAHMGEVAVDTLDRMLREGSLHPRTYVLPVPVLWREPETTSTG